MTFPKHIKKRDGSIDEFNSFKIKEAIFNAVREIYTEKPEPIVDEKRFEYVKKCLMKDYDLTEKELESRMIFYHTRMRPLSPDECGIVGPSTYIPNLLFNTGTGPWGFQAPVNSKIVTQMLLSADQPNIVSDYVIQSINP